MKISKYLVLIPIKKVFNLSPYVKQNEVIFLYFITQVLNPSQEN